MVKKKGFFLYFVLFIFLFTIIFVMPANGEYEIIDGIIAVVNENIITLTDLKIVRAFDLLGRKIEADEGDDKNNVLEKMIEQKLAVQMTGEKDILGEGELNTALQKELTKLNNDLLKSKLERFDIRIDDLKEYLKEKVLYQSLISRRFSGEVFVNLEELKLYYDEIYVPAKEKKNQKPLPMIKILSKIESLVKEEKLEKQIEEWLDYLKDKADIQIFTDEYIEYFNK